MPAAATSGWLLQGGNGFPGDPVEGLAEPADPIVEALYQLVAKTQLVQRCEGGVVQSAQAILPYQQHGPVNPTQQPPGSFNSRMGWMACRNWGRHRGTMTQRCSATACSKAARHCSCVPFRKR